MDKTTTARTLAARFDRAVHLQADVFFDFIRSGFVEPWKPESREQNEVVMGIVADTAAAYAAAGYFTILDGIVYPPGSSSLCATPFAGRGTRLPTRF